MLFIVLFFLQSPILQPRSYSTTDVINFLLCSGLGSIYIKNTSLLVSTHLIKDCQSSLASSMHLAFSSQPLTGAALMNSNSKVSLNKNTLTFSKFVICFFLIFIFCDLCVLSVDNTTPSLCWLLTSGMSLTIDKNSLSWGFQSTPAPGIAKYKSAMLPLGQL